MNDPHRPTTGDTRRLDSRDLHDWIEAARRALPDDDPTGALDHALAESRRVRQWLAEHEWEVR